jgi:hypothetical protein
VTIVAFADETTLWKSSGKHENSDGGDLAIPRKTTYLNVTPQYPQKPVGLPLARFIRLCYAHKTALGESNGQSDSRKRKGIFLNACNNRDRFDKLADGAMFFGRQRQSF